MAEVRLLFRAWLQHGDGIFHVSGKPGAGKSTLMKYLCKSQNTRKLLELWAGDSVLVLSNFFFWKPGEELQRSLSGLIRGLLYRLLSACPNLIPAVLPLEWERSRAHEHIYLERDQIRAAFDALVSSQESRLGHKFVFFIDGLDEFTGDHAELVQKLFEWTSRTKDIKICVSSREWTLFKERFRDCPSFKLHNLTRWDIERVVRDKLNEAVSDGTFQGAECNVDEIAESITDKSDGVFLWVNTVLRLVLRGLVNGDRMSDLQKKIGSLPTELEVMFQHLFDAIPRQDKQISYLILDMALLIAKANSQQCCLSRYSFLGDYLTNRNFAISMPTKPMDRVAIIDRLKRARKRIYGVCTGFLDIVPHFVIPAIPGGSVLTEEGGAKAIQFSGLFGGAVKFTHRSAVEFLEGGSVRKRIKEGLADTDTFDACCQTLLAQVKAICMHHHNLHIPLAKPRASPGIRPSGSSSIESPPPSGVVKITTAIGGVRSVFRSKRERISTLPDELSNDFEDLAHHAATNVDLDASRFEKFTVNASDAIKAFKASPVSVQLWQAELGTSFVIAQTVDLDVAALPSLAMAQVGAPLSNSTLALGIKLWMLLVRMEAVTISGSRHEAGIAVRNLRLYLDVHSTPNESPGGILPWHYYLFACCRRRPVLPVIAIFLYHGANIWFWIVAESESLTDTIYFSFESGVERKRGAISEGDDAHRGTHLYRSSFSAEYAEFWRRHSYKVSFRDLVALWFPEHADQLLPVVDWLAEQDGELSPDGKQTLKSKFGAQLRPLFEADITGRWCSDKVITEYVGEEKSYQFGSMVPGETLYMGR